MSSIAEVVKGNSAIQDNAAAEHRMAREAREKREKKAKKAKPAAEVVKAPKAKKVKTPDNVSVSGPREYSDSRKGTTVVQHSASYTFATGNKYSVSAVLRALGYYCGASGPQGKLWCDAVGLSATNASTCGQQTGAGRRHAKGKGGKPDNEGYGGWHGSVPLLSPDERAELKASFERATAE